jgi:hypothetical protein
MQVTTDTAGDTSTSRRPPVAVQPRTPRPAPLRVPELHHLELQALRTYRKDLGAEENLVSYWRRILQARLDVVVSGTSARGAEHQRLAPVLTTSRMSAGRAALVQVLPVDGIPPLPRLGELWDRQVDADDELGRAAFADDLRAAEDELSAYRAALHERIAEVTAELIARYREDPALCLSALPLQRTAGS